MSDNFDVVCYPAMLNKYPVSLKGCVSYKFLKRITLPVPENGQIANYTWTYDITEKTPNSKLFAVVVKGGDGAIVGSFGDYKINSISEISIGDKSITISIYSLAWNAKGGISNSGIVDVYEMITKDSQTGDTYGIEIVDGVDWTRFADMSSVGCMVHYEKLTLTDSGWGIPSTVENPERCLIFANWNSDSVSLRFDIASKKVVKSGADVVVELFVFTIPETIQPPSCGMVMYNQNGDITFSSENVPLCSPETVVPNREYIKMPFSKNLVHLSDYGFKVDCPTGQTLGRIDMYDIGIMKYNDQVKFARQGIRNRFNVKIRANDYNYPSGGVLVLNAAVYQNA